jgi:nucleotidyltransferase substrate binding protein (TIGR01987 family)
MNLKLLKKAIQRFEKMLVQSKRTDLLESEIQEAVRESLLQRFEYTLEMAWKSAKRYLVECEKYSKEMGPKTVLRTCGELGLLNTETWLLYMEARQNISHDYSESKVLAVLEAMSRFQVDVNDLYRILEQRLSQATGSEP